MRFFSLFFSHKNNHWISVKDQKPNPKEKILVFCKSCLKTHSVYNDYDEWNLSGWCEDGEWSSPECVIYFDYWQPLPNPPKEPPK
jgi:hypothetical protein